MPCSRVARPKSSAVSPGNVIDDRSIYVGKASVQFTVDKIMFASRRSDIYDRQIHRQAGRQAGRQAVRQAGRTDIYSE